MSCYVDTLANHGWTLRGTKVRNCHLIADTLPELHSMANAIGMRREWFQPESSPHYDLTERRRAKAIELGAIELDRAAFVAKLREMRAKVFEPGEGACGVQGEPATGHSGVAPHESKRLAGRRIASRSRI